MLEIDDLSFLDMDELGVRPDALANDEIAHGMDFDSTTVDLFGQKKFVEFPSGKVDLSQMNSSTLEEEEEFEYDIDPETGEKIFREAILGSSHSLSSSSSSTPSDYCWVEEYLSNLPTVPVDIPKRSVIDHPTSSHSDFDWQRNNSALFYPMEEKSSLFHSSSETFYLPLNNENQSSYHLYGVSTDDEHSISNGSQGRRFYSSTETTLFERNLHHNGQFLPAKLEKIEHDEHAISPLFVRRSSTRSNSQGQQDEDLLRRANIPLTVHDITQSSTEEYNRHLARLNHLTPEQMHIIKDIRRRGKNKIAAQNCRKRKANSVEVLLEEVDELKRMKNDLEERKQIYQQQIDETRREYEYLHHQVHPNRPIPPTIFVK